MKFLTRRKTTIVAAVLMLLFSCVFAFTPTSFALTNNNCQGNNAGHCQDGADNNGNNGDNQPETQPNGTFSTGDNKHRTVNDICGDGDDAVALSIKVGCKGKGNPIADMTFAIIRILSDGVGLVVIASIIFGGIQYTGSRGDPQSTAMAVNRIRSSIFALIIFIFGYAILNFIIPAGFLQ